MTNVKKKIFLPIGVSFLALIAFQASVQAQEATTEAPEASAVEPGLPDAGAVTAMIENAPTAKPREISDAVDPVAKADLERLDREGVVGKQARLGEEILIINRQIRRAEAIKELLGYLGVEGFKKEYPELAEQLKDSPILLEADLNRAKILAEIAAIGTEEEAKPLAARDDGSSFFSQNGLAMPRDTPIATPSLFTEEGELDPALSEIIAQKVAEATAKLAENAPIDTGASAAAQPISLREVYGLSGSLYAIIVYGDERIRVAEGDELPSGVQVKAIDPDSITILRDGVETRIQIKG